jgi:ferric-dicitrate binding protein FerR (iron transport regulator)
MPEYRFWNLLAKKISGEATAEEMQELEDLMRLHPEYHYAAQHIQDIWGLSTAEDPLAAEESFKRHLNRMKKMGITLDNPENNENDSEDTRPKRNRKKLLFIGIMGIAALVAFFFLQPTHKATEPSVQKTSEVSTRMGSRSELVLPDGSTVWLNAGSKLVYNKDFGNKIREVTLVGEAFFDVTHMAELPFVIQTPVMEVKVLGTRFNIKAYPNESTTETSVIRGRVEISPRKRPGERFVLSANEKLILSNSQVQNEKEEGNKIPKVVLGSITYSKKDSAVIETSWVENKLMFDDEPFATLATRMERWYGVTISFTDKKVEDIHLTGTLVNESIQEALEALQLSSNFSGNNFHYHINQNIVTITK